MSAARRLSNGSRLSALLGRHAGLPPQLDRDVLALAADSREVVPGTLFFARAGLRVDGASFIDAARQAGAVAVVRQGPAGVRALADGVVEVRVADLLACMADVARAFHGDPAAGMRLVGVTGTNGKTSVSHFIAAALHRPPSAPCGLLGTLGYGLPGALAAGLHTTPDVLDIHARLAELRDAGARQVVMEVSSHALEQGRVLGLPFRVAVFTNLTRDHLDYHADMTEYAAAKRRLFDTPGLATAVLNVDDAFGRELRGTLRGDVAVLTYSLEDDTAAVLGRVLALDDGGLRLGVRTPWGEGEIASRLAGRFNASNLLAALATLGSLGQPFEATLAALAAVTAPPGRMERFGGGAQPLVVVDYSHTPDALATALGALRPQCAGRLWCVFGCGGDRDRGKRPLMGEVAMRLADRVVVTDDNPRGEDGDRIVADILAGTGGIGPVVERDRARAIGLAVAEAAADDVVLVAGKGHEPYQEVAGVRRPFSDADEVRAALARRAGGAA